MIVAMRNFIPDRRALSAEKNPVPCARRAYRCLACPEQAKTITRSPAPAQQEDGIGVPEPERAAGSAGDPPPNRVPSQSTLANRSTHSTPPVRYVPLFTDTAHLVLPNECRSSGPFKMNRMGSTTPRSHQQKSVNFPTRAIRGRSGGGTGAAVLPSLCREIEHSSTPMFAGRCSRQSLSDRQRCRSDRNRLISEHCDKLSNSKMPDETCSARDSACRIGIFMSATKLHRS
jgi:hypothetical protein